jgi:uncharacterized protein
MVSAIKKFLIRLLHQEKSPHMLALSFCMGNYIAFSPFLGLHTAMIFVFSWLFGLNLAVTFASSYFINNPITMIPLYSADYMVGYWLFYRVLQWDMMAYNPSWVTTMNRISESHIGISLPCFWSFFVGGNVLGVVSSVLLYPVMKHIFSKMLTDNTLKSLPYIHENSRAK